MSRGRGTAGTRPRVLPVRWNATPQEDADTYPCDRLATLPVVTLTRAIGVGAPPSVVFRWVCQLRVAPYSYDWLDNLGRRSPRMLTSGAEHLAVGQPLLVGTITSFTTDEHLTFRATERAERMFGVVAGTYCVRAADGQGSRLIARLVVHRPVELWERARYQVLAWGDLVMMRGQLRTLKKLAEASAGADRLSGASLQPRPEQAEDQPG